MLLGSLGFIQTSRGAMQGFRAEKQDSEMDASKERWTPWSWRTFQSLVARRAQHPSPRAPTQPARAGRGVSLLTGSRWDVRGPESENRFCRTWQWGGNQAAWHVPARKPCWSPSAPRCSPRTHVAGP